MRSGEQDALARQLVEPRAPNVRVTIDTEIAAEVVPMHQQHIVTAVVCCLLVADYRHLLRFAGSVDVIGSGVLVAKAGPVTNAAVDIRRGQVGPAQAVAADHRAIALRPEHRLAAGHRSTLAACPKSSGMPGPT